MAGHTLRREYEDYLPPKEAIRRLRRVFKYVKADHQKAVEEIKEWIERLKDRQRRGFDIVDKISQLEQAMPESYYVTVSDTETLGLKSLSTVLYPNLPSVFGYESPRHQKAVWPLVKRVAKALDYDIED